MTGFIKVIGVIVFIVGIIALVIAIPLFDVVTLLGSIYMMLVGAVTIAFGQVVDSVHKLVKLGEAQVAELRMLVDGAKPKEPS